MSTFSPLPPKKKKEVGVAAAAVEGTEGASAMGRINPLKGCVKSQRLPFSFQQ